MTGPEGNSEFCFSRISMFPETIRGKQNTWPENWTYEKGVKEIAPSTPLPYLLFLAVFNFFSTLGVISRLFGVIWCKVMTRYHINSWSSAKSLYEFIFG